MKRLFTLILVVAVMFMFGCGGTENTQDPEEKSAKADKGKNKITQIVLETLIINDIETELQGGDSAVLLSREELFKILGLSFEIDAKTLSREYNENEVAADAKYKNKSVLVRGVVESIAKDAFDNPYLSIKGSQMFHTVHANFPDSALDDLAKIKKGQNVSLICNVEGMIIGSVMMDKCSSIKSYANGNQVRKVANRYAKDLLTGKSENCEFLTYANIYAKRVQQGSPCYESVGDSCVKDIDQIIKNTEKWTEEENEQLDKCGKKAE